MIIIKWQNHCNKSKADYTNVVITVLDKTVALH